MDMTGQQDIRTTFIFSPPVDNAQAWHLRLNDLADAIRRDFPGASAKLRRTMGQRSSDALSFEVEIQEGLWLEGLATTPFEGIGTVMVLGATVSEAAVFAAWLRDVFIPEPDLIRFSSERALEDGDMTEWHLPARGQHEAISTALKQHVDAVS